MSLPLNQFQKTWLKHLWKTRPPYWRPISRLIFFIPLTNVRTIPFLFSRLMLSFIHIQFLRVCVDTTAQPGSMWIRCMTLAMQLHEFVQILLSSISIAAMKNPAYWPLRIFPLYSIIIIYRMPNVEFEICASAKLMCRADLPGRGVDVDVILGQNVCDCKNILNWRDFLMLNRQKFLKFH